MKTKEKILVGAKDYLLKNGQEGFSIRAIASEAGVNQGLVYHYFGAKENLILALIDYVATGPFEEIKKKAVGLAPEEIRDLVLMVLLSNSDLMNMIIEFVTMARRSARIREKMQAIMRERREFLTAVLGITDPEEKVALNAGVFGIILMSRIDSSISMEKALVKLLKIFNVG